MRESRLPSPRAQFAHLVGVDRASLGDAPLGGIDLLLDEAPRPRLPLGGLGVEARNDRHARQLAPTSSAAAASGTTSGAA